MHNLRMITEDIIWTGGFDRRLDMFEAQYPISDGMMFNSYLIKDEKTVLFDTVDKHVAGMFFENLKAALDGRALDYLVVQHMEPDHSATLAELVLRYPDVKIICNQKTVTMIKQFFDLDIDSRAVLVNEGDKMSFGSHEITFITAPMVHWPEVMMSYDSKDKVLFSADAFGSFGTMSGSIFAASVDFAEYLPEARRYYTNIVGKYGAQVQMVLKKASALEIGIIAPLHGLVWTSDNASQILEKYDKWSSYTPEEDGVAVLFGSVHGNTANAAEVIASKIADKGCKVKVIDLSVKHHSEAVAQAFRFSKIVIVTATLDGGIFPKTETAVRAMSAHNLQKRTVAVVDNGTWAPVAGKGVKEILSACKEMNIIEEGFSFKSSLKDADMTAVEALVNAICD